MGVSRYSTRLGGTLWPLQTSGVRATVIACLLAFSTAGCTAKTDQLFRAIAQGDLGRVQALVHGSRTLANSVSTSDDTLGARSALQEAVINSKPGIAAYLLNCSADPDYVDTLGYTAIHYAALSGNLQMVRVLLQHGANPRLRGGPRRMTPLETALYHNQWRAVTALADASPDSGISVLHLQVIRGDMQAAGETARRNPSAIDGCDGLGRTPVHYAVLCDKAEVLRMLLSTGANPGIKDMDKRTPLIEAAARGKLESVKLLLQSGARVDAPDRELFTPLHMAAANGHRAVVRELLRSGGDCRKANVYGDTPLDLAKRNGFDSVARDLEP